MAPQAKLKYILLSKVLFCDCITAVLCDKLIALKCYPCVPLNHNIGTAGLADVVNVVVVVVVFVLLYWGEKSSARL